MMYRRPKFLEILLEIRQEMAREADYDVDLFAEMVRGGKFSNQENGRRLIETQKDENLNGTNARPPRTTETDNRKR